MLHYLLQIVAFQVFFLIIYDVFLKRVTFFNWNRVYLMGTAALSFALPFFKFESIKAIVPEPMVIRLPEVIIGDLTPVHLDSSSMVQAEQVVEQTMSFSWTYIWMAGMVLAAFILIFKISKIIRLYYKNPQRWQGDALIVFLLNSNAAFSFFHCIFLGTAVQDDKKELILQHELVHVKERHSIDLLLFEVLRILFWFNPLIYMYQNRLTTLHEFIADAKAVTYKGKSAYYQSLLSQVFETQQISFINPFFKQSLIKKRIVMLSKSKSRQIHVIKYALLIPMVMGMLMYTSSYASEIKESLPLGHNDVVAQETPFTELVNKYYNAVIDLDDLPDDYYKAFKNYGDIGENYMQGKQDVAKAQALLKYKHTKLIEKKKAEGKLSVQEEGDLEFYGQKQYSYEEYVAYKKTDKAKSNWENNATDGELRLVVENIGNLTSAEQKRKEEKLALILKDDFYNKLTLVDATSSVTSDFGTKDAEVKTLNMESEDVEVPLVALDEIPLFLNSMSLGSIEQDRKSISDSIAQFVAKNFNVDIAKEQKLKGRQRISVIFKIGTDGIVKDIQARAPHPALEAEAIRVIKALPEFIPGKLNGKAVTVPYSLPILFQVNDDVSEKDSKSNGESEQNIIKEKYEIIDGEVPYAVVDEVPRFPSCEALISNNERKQCTSDEISRFVNKNFNVNLASDLGLQGAQRISVIFKIGKDGAITDIRSRGTHPDLEKEAIRVIGELPKMIPGKHSGKPVVVPYSLPIMFQVYNNPPKSKN